jgi:DNA-directed RNA polymerase specialized sigma subunit
MGSAPSFTRFWRGETQTEASRRLRMSRQTVVEIEQRALQRMRRELAPVLGDTTGVAVPG